MALLVRAFPLKAQEAQLQAFVEELKGRRREQAGRFYQAHGVSHESWYLQRTEMGPWVIGLTQVDNVADSAPRFAAADDDFAGWFKGTILALSGVDSSQQPLGPPTQLVYDWSTDQQVAKVFAPPGM